MSEPIYEPGPNPTPVTYEAVGATPIEPIACYAEFDGTNASGSFKPVLIFTSQAGHTFMQAATDETLAAGESAAVSWFPRVGAAASSGASTGVQWARVTRNTAFTVAAASPIRRVPWTAHQFSDTSVFTLKTTTATDDTIVCHAPGAYLVSGFADWAAPATYGHNAEIGSDMFTLNIGVATPVSSSNTRNTETGEERFVGDYQWLVPQTLPADLYLLTRNFDAVNRNVVQAALGVFYWPNATVIV